ncbi:MAG: hypothetical protein QNJ46_03355 [Leptolyngbyaceae cyanobacterium MO_188.B28]|nr:hypothetical protein [Leptolyngbyaceae cyanobacterium MO_188.B28]
MANIVVKVLRPLVNTKIQQLGQTSSIQSKLSSMVKEWMLNYVGIPAQVTRIGTDSDQIHICLTVGKPDYTDSDEWRQVIDNLRQSIDNAQSKPPTYRDITPDQQQQVHQILAHLIRSGSPDQDVLWETVYPHLRVIDPDESMLKGVKSALENPQIIDPCTEDLDPDVAEIALSQATKIAILHQHINLDVNSSLTVLLNAMKNG